MKGSNELCDTESVLEINISLVFYEFSIKIISNDAFLMRDYTRQFCGKIQKLYTLTIIKKLY